MSSSVFFENSVPTGANSVDGDVPSSANSNLVLVYGKNGISFDQKGLESLIEGKTLSSISVVRLTSPTTSMEAEEDEAEKLEKMLSRQNLESDEDVESLKNSDNGANDGDETPDKSENDETEEEQSTTSESNSFEEDEANECSEETTIKQQKVICQEKEVRRTKGKQQKERPDIVGLTLEEFYPPEDAKELAKEILRKAGVSIVKNSTDTEFQLYVINSDHCYTPFTSPSQMKAKLIADKLESEKHTTASRKTVPQTSSSVKQFITKRRLTELDRSSSLPQKKLNLKVRRNINKDQEEPYSDEFAVDDEETISSIDEQEDETDFSAREESAETDNDRDSDLDFDVNNRRGRKRKGKLQKKSKHGLINKSQNRRQRQSQDESDDSVANTQRVKITKLPSHEATRPAKSLMTTPPGMVSSKPIITSVQVFPAPFSRKLPFFTEPNVAGKFTQQPTAVVFKTSNPNPAATASVVRRGPIVQVGGPSTSRNAQAQTGQQNVKEIIINKVMDSPKGGFTNIGALLSQTDQPPTPSTLISIPTTPTSSTRSQAQSLIHPSSKGFLQLGVESAVKHQLPSQISIQTHQSSSELLAAEHDKQLDLIDSIVNDQLEKTGVDMVEQTPPNVPKNIPEIVKMLESTEKSLESKKVAVTPPMNQPLTAATHVDDIDIHSTLLGTAAGEIPDELLEHVAKLIEGDQSLQEAVENQVFGTTGRSATALSSTTTHTLAPLFQQTTPTLANIVEDMHRPEMQHQQTKSIIELSISNVCPSTSVNPSNPLSSFHGTRTTPPIRKEPIKIVRGNGRVITLPPIEAPTTRAKRRQQDTPHESSLESWSLPTTPVVEMGAAEKTAVSSFAAGRGRSAANTSGSKTSKRTTAAAAKKTAAGKAVANIGKNDTETEASSQDDDDDPNKLWCICRQPHNNRFMICCDICEDWFHGTCVSVTKAMGIEMEENGIDWTCPQCKQKQEEKKQPRISDMLPVKPTAKGRASLKATSASKADAQEKTAAVRRLKTTANPKAETQSKVSVTEVKKHPVSQTATSNKNFEQAQRLQATQRLQHGTQPTKQAKAPATQKIHIQKVVTINKFLKPVQQQQEDKPTKAVEDDPLSLCTVCKKNARPNTIYCSDDCIRRHAQNAINAFAVKTPEPDVTNPHAQNLLEEKKKKGKGLFEDLLLMADRKPKAERVHVVDRKAGRVLCGNSAPTTLNLRKWLHDNPTFEVVPPGSKLAHGIELKQNQRAQPTVVATPVAFPNNPNKSLPSSTVVAPPAAPMPSAPIQAKIKSPVQITADAASSKPMRTSPPQAKTSLANQRAANPKQSQKSAQPMAIKSDKPAKVESKEENGGGKVKEKQVKRQNSDGGTKKASENADHEITRLNVRRTLEQQLMSRMNEASASSSNLAKLKPEEIEEFVSETEMEMFEYFNHDCGARYKAKYRSLMFNIRDRKNQTLFAKICEKLIEPKQLVRMSPEEMASQELAQWREKEAKHQLEMIKKSELDMLACNKNYVLKTHKGEEVIEGNSAVCVEMDMTIPVEDVVSEFNKSTGNADETASAASATPKESLFSTTDLNTSQSSMIVDDKSEEDKIKLTEIETEAETSKAERHRERTHKRERDKNRSHKKEKRHRSRQHHHSDKSLVKKHRSRTHSRSRSPSKERRHKSSHREERRDRELSREKERSREKEHSHERGKSREKERSREKEHSHERGRSHGKERSHEKGRSREKEHESSAQPTKTQQQPAAPANSMETYNLIDQILDSTKTVEEAANIVTEKPVITYPSSHTLSTTESPLTSTSSTQSSFATSYSKPFTASHAGNTPSTSISSNSIVSRKSVDHSPEPTSDISSSKSPQDPYTRYTAGESEINIWGGTINMIDLASFQIVLQPVVGNSLSLGQNLPQELNIVGRIPHGSVWDYISKIQRSPNKAILIIRLLPSSELETAAYTVLYQYLHRRHRLGVVGTNSPHIKDFYILPLATGKQMPEVLRTYENNEFYEDPYRPDILMGIIVSITGKRPNLLGSHSSSSSEIKSSMKLSRGLQDIDERTFTPPGSPKRRKRKSTEIDIDAIIKGPIAAKRHKSVRLDIPAMVSPPSNDADEPYSPGGGSDYDVPSLPAKSKAPIEDDELKRQMDDINRQIAEQEEEIAGLINVNSSIYPSPSTSKVLAKISIPDNITQILESIKMVTPPTTTTKTMTHAASRMSRRDPMNSSSSRIAGNKPSPVDDDDEEYNPEDAIVTSYNTSVKNTERPTTSRLAQLSEAELLSMVPDDMMMDQAPSSFRNKRKT